MREFVRVDHGSQVALADFPIGYLLSCLLALFAERHGSHLAGATSWPTGPEGIGTRLRYCMSAHWT